MSAQAEVWRRRHEEPSARAWDTRQPVPRSGDSFLLHFLSGRCSSDILPVDSSASDHQPHTDTSSPVSSVCLKLTSSFPPWVSSGIHTPSGLPQGSRKRFLLLVPTFSEDPQLSS